MKIFGHVLSWNSGSQIFRRIGLNSTDMTKIKRRISGMVDEQNPPEEMTGYLWEIPIPFKTTARVPQSKNHQRNTVKISSLPRLPRPQDMGPLENLHHYKKTTARVENFPNFYLVKCSDDR